MLEEHCFMVCRRQPTREEQQKNLAEKWHFHFFFTYPLKQLLFKFIFIKYPQHERFLLQFHPTYDLAAEKWVRKCQWIKGGNTGTELPRFWPSKSDISMWRECKCNSPSGVHFYLCLSGMLDPAPLNRKVVSKFIQTHLYFFFFNLTKVIR